MTTYRLFPATNGPASTTAASGNWMLGVVFSVTGGMRWLDGYWFWNPNNGDTVPRKCGLWNVYTGNTGQLVPNSVVTQTGNATQGAWNFVQLPAPVQLAPGGLYVAAIGWTATNGIPLTASQFSSGQPFANGIVNGPLTAYSSGTGTNAQPMPYITFSGQMVFSNVLGSDPSVNFPNNGSNNNNLWVDISIDDTAPNGYTGSYRLYPNRADLDNFTLDTANGFTLGKQFTLSINSTLNNAWFYSPASVTILPSSVGFYRTSDQSLVVVNSSPSWSGVAGSGWISTPITGTLPVGTYKYVVFQGANQIWNAAVANYYTTGFGGNGLVSGPISVPNNANALSPGQESYHQAATISYPDTNAGPFTYGLDFELTPILSTPVTVSDFLAFSTQTSVTVTDIIGINTGVIPPQGQLRQTAMDRTDFAY